MSTALTHHHGFLDPSAAALAVALVIGGAAVIGVAVSGTDTAPSAPTAPAQVAPHPSGTGKAPQPHKGADHRTTFRGGGHPMAHRMIGLP